MAVKQIRIEDIEVDIPVAIDDRISKATRRTIGGGLLSQAKHFNTGTVSIDLVGLSKDQSDRIGELVRNYAFNDTMISGISDIWDGRIIIDSLRFDHLWYDRSGQISGNLQLFPIWNFIAKVMERPLYDKWKYLVQEDFDTDSVWTGTMGTNWNSTGYGNQVQDIPWHKVSGTWVINSDNALIGDGVGDDTSIEVTSNLTTAVLLAGWDWWENYVVESWIYADDDAEDGRGIVFRYVNSTNRGMFFVNDGGTTASLRLIIGNQLIASTTDHPLTVDTWYHFKVECIGNRYKCYLNGRLVFDKTDDTLVAGPAGMYSYRDNVHFDDFRVTLLPSTNFNLPSVVNWTNQYSVGDVETAYGTQQRIVGPQEEIEFKINGTGSDCILYLPMSEGSGMSKDYSQNRCEIGIHGTTWVEDEEKGWCLEFDGVGDHVNANIDGLLDTSEYLTVSFDIYLPSTIAGTDYFVSLNLNDVDSFEWYGSSTQLLFYNDINNANELVYTYDYTSNTWLNIVTMFNGSTFLCFIDNQLVCIYEEPNGYTIADIDANYLTIGRNSWIGSGYGNCRVKNVRIYDTIRWDVAIGFDSTPATVFVWDDNRYDDSIDYPDDSACVLLLRFDEGRGTTTFDASGKGHDGTLTNGPTWSHSSFRGEAGSAVEFSGVLGNNEHVSISDHDDFSFDAYVDLPCSFEFWFKVDSLTNSRVIMSKRNSTGSQEEWQVHVNTLGALYVYFYRNDGTGYTRAYTATGEVVTGKWYYGCTTYDGSETDSGINIYLDGVDAKSAGSTSNYAGMTNGTAPVRIGIGDDGTENDFDGIIGEVRIHRKEMSAGEITARYRSEPYLHDWYQMTRVYYKGHPWKGLPVISNGLVLLSFPEFDTYENRTNNVLLPTIHAWYENSWHLLGFIEPRFYPNGDNFGYYSDVEATTFEILELTDQYCKIRIWVYEGSSASFPEGSVGYMDLTVRNGFPGVIFEREKREWWEVWRSGFRFARTTGWGMGNKGAYVYVPEDNIYDEDILGATQNVNLNVCDDNWCVLFHAYETGNAPSNASHTNVITGFCSDTEVPSDTDSQFYLTYGSNSGWYRIYVNQTKYGAVFFVPYNMDLIYREADSDYSDVATTGQNDQTTLSGSTGDGYILLTGAATEYARWNVGTLSKGMYMAAARVASTSATEKDGYFYIDDDATPDGDIKSKSFTVNLQNTWEYQFLPFYTDGTDNIYISILNQDILDVICVDHFFCFPLSNGFNYPSDLAHMAFSDIKVVRA